ncbi:MAG: putative lipoic acid-binding regulatory protein [Arenicella sp.]|jgi:putative lipoic acid-binding regulatory protein
MENYDKLKELLEAQTYPLLYPFKFIIKEDQEKLVQIKRIFEETAEFQVRKSKNGNYSSITIKQMMLNTDDIIAKYEQMKGIEGIISL